MLAVTYPGPHDELEIAGTGITIKRGETRDLSPDDLAQELCDSGVLELAEKPRTTKKGDLS